MRRRLDMEVIEAIDVRASVVQVAPRSKRLEHRLSNSTCEQQIQQQIQQQIHEPASR